MHKNIPLLRALALAFPLALASAAPAALAQSGDATGQGRNQAYSQPVVAKAFPADAAQHAQQLNADTSTPHIGKGAKGPAVLRAQVLLDRQWFSPGQLDGLYGRNMRHALLAFQRARGLQETGVVDAPTWQALQQGQQAPVFSTYQVTQEDVQGPYKKIPDDPVKQADLDRLTYESLQEALSERFHIKPELLASLNKGRPMQAGQQIVVTNVGARVALPAGDEKSRNIVISKSDRMLYLMGQGDQLLAAFPVSIGGRGDDLPVGKSLEINSDVKDPDFRYDAKLLDGYDRKEPVVVPPGPNSPVGVLWMGLSKPHWGIHGTSEPSEMARVQTNGCIRMTNWDALRLTEHVGIGTQVKLVS